MKKQKKFSYEKYKNFVILWVLLELKQVFFSSIPGGADAKPFITHHNALDSDFYLRIVTELLLKNYWLVDWKQFMK